MVRLKGFEPLTFALEGHCSIQLSYKRLLYFDFLWGSNSPRSAPQNFVLLSRLTRTISHKFPQWVCARVQREESPRFFVHWTHSAHLADLLPEMPLLYPADIQTLNGAGEGNRTLATSLEGWCSTIELHPHASREHENLIITQKPCQE